jgi:PhnB protein
MQIQPYLYFDGRCEEAIEFYKTALSAKVQMLMRFKDSPEPHQPAVPNSDNKVMHANLTIGNSTVLASDGLCGGKPNFAGITLSIIVSTPAEAERYFTGLSDGGKVNMPLTKTFFSPGFGMVTDRFGVSWMVLAEQ